MLNESDMDAGQAPASANNPLEPFLLLAKSAKGAAAAELIRQVLEAPGVYVFGELLAMPNVLELESTEHAPHLHTLRLFAYGTCSQYLANRAQLLDPLSAAMQRKLQHLTIVSLAVPNKQLAYDALLAELGCQSVRQLEDLIIDAIYADVVHGRLDQRKRLFEVDHTIGRDVREHVDVAAVKRTLTEWSASCETVLACIEQQIVRANEMKAAQLKAGKDIEAEQQHIRQALRAQPQDDEAMAAECSLEVRGGASGGGGVVKRVAASKAKVQLKAAKASN